MAKYIATVKAFIDGNLLAPGDQFDWEGKPEKWMKPLKDEKKKSAPKDGGSEKKGQQQRETDQEVI